MYTAREVTTVLGMSPSRLRSYLRAGFVAPSKGDDGELRFSFHDLVLLRKAEGLMTDRIAPRRVHSALRKLRERLGDGATIAGLRLAAEGRTIVVDDGQARWVPESGQMVFSFEHAAPRDEGAPITPLVSVRAANQNTSAGAPRLSAREHYDRGCELEDSAPAEAMAAYRAALKQDPELADAHVNLGRLLHEAGELHGALTHYRAALAARSEDATAAFNLGVALEDLGNAAEAVDAYERAIACDPMNADAHYNVARLLEQAGKPEMAIRHLLMYRHLTKKPGR